MSVCVWCGCDYELLLREREKEREREREKERERGREKEREGERQRERELPCGWQSCLSCVWVCASHKSGLTTVEWITLPDHFQQ